MKDLKTIRTIRVNKPSTPDLKKSESKKPIRASGYNIQAGITHTTKG